MTRILLDMDNTIYDIDSPWIDAHNVEYPDHILRADDLTSWDRTLACKDNNCAADIYKYLQYDSIWLNGKPIENSVSITEQWTDQKYEVGIVTSVPYSAKSSVKLKYEWLNQYFPHITNIITVSNHTKHWIEGDFLVDDGIHNLTDFNGIRIIYDAPWNRDSKLIRAKDWNQVDRIIQRGVILMKRLNGYRIIEQIIIQDIKDGLV